MANPNATSTVNEGPPLLDRVNALVEGLGVLARLVRAQEADLSSCRTGAQLTTQALAACDARVVRAAAGRAPTDPEGTVTYGGCWASSGPDRNRVMSQMGVAPPDAADVVGHCAQLAATKGVRGEPVWFGVRNGTECWVAEDERAARRGGQTRGCTLPPDGRGRSVGGVDALALYTLQPRGVRARFLRLVRRHAPRDVQPDPDGAHMHIAGLLASDESGPLPPFVAVSASEDGPQRLPDPQPGEPPADGALSETLARLNERPLVLGAKGASVCLGPRVGAHLTLDFGAAVRVTSIQLRNRVTVGVRPDLEARLAGCWVQLLSDLDLGAASPLWEAQVRFGAPSYHFEPR